MSTPTINNLVTEVAAATTVTESSPTRRARSNAKLVVHICDESGIVSTTASVAYDGSKLERVT